MGGGSAGAGAGAAGAGAASAPPAAFASLGGGLGGSLLGSSFGGSALGCFALGALTLLALAALLGEFFFLDANLLGLVAGFFLAPGKLFSLVHHRGGGRAFIFGDRTGGFVTLDEHALLAHLHLDGACLAGSVGLLDLAG